MNALSPEILLIDDKLDDLNRLATLVREQIGTVEVRGWHPSRTEDASKVFNSMVGTRTVLVVTDYDLTTAVRGLFGHSVVGWCRRRLIPVGDFSRAHQGELPTEPDLFKLRVPRSEVEAVTYIVRVFEGFRWIREEIKQNPILVSGGRSPAQLLATLLGRQYLESQLAPYFSRPGLFNSFLLDVLRHFASKTTLPTAEDKTRVLTYLLGHVLANVILKYPGPILTEESLCAYLATSPTKMDQIAKLFDRARYKGPFSYGERSFWREHVDETVEELARKFEVEDSKYRSYGDYHRAVMAKTLGGHGTKHECDRCGGVKGGFWCPFTKRAVCERYDCSSAASSWVPTGAHVCRVEREYFDELSPVLGL